MDIKEYINSNKIAWEEVNELHQQFKTTCKEKFILEDFHVLDQNLLDNMNEIEFKNKSILHLCCNDGEEIISLKKLGAGECLGIDISKEAISSARDLNEKLTLDVEFVVSDIYDLDTVTDKSFDIILFTVGTLVWLPDLEKVFNKIKKVLHKDSYVVIQEQHPFSWLIDDTMKLSKSEAYFKKEPLREEGGLDYLGKKEYEGSVNYTFNYTFSELFNSMINIGLRMYKFYEYPNDISNLKDDLEEEAIAFPLSYICIFKKD